MMLALFLGVSAGCTQNQRARLYGGKSAVKMDRGRKVVTATWKDTSIWVLTRPMGPEEEPQTLILKEISSLGLLEGEVELIEQK